ncbi:alpha/beta hydrolase [Tateyamaria sp. SN6-1]|uniref:alpha/beta hydrolase n=1 Tax=Tateyamaria sp. SN6-1 TaxID=3092148 RepID=UPI0039F59820
MRAFGKFLGRALAVLFLIGVGLWVFGPYEPAPLDPTGPPVGADLDAHFDAVEGAFDDIVPGTQKRVEWAGAAGDRTDWSVLYVHGFSASSEEIRPVPDLVAKSLGANLIYTRLQGHGRGADAMSEATVQGWVNDLAEGMQAARAAGDKVIVMSTSTGGTLVAAMAQNADVMDGAAGLIFVSPNFGLNNPLAPLLSWPAARYWLPPLAGARRSFEPRNEGHATYWTTEYDSVAVMPMVALIDAVNAMDHSAQTLPALFWFATADEVVQPMRTAEIAQAWGGASTVVNPVMGPDDDPQSHVIAGDVLSPGQSEAAAAGMLDWIAGLN